MNNRWWQGNSHDSTGSTTTRKLLRDPRKEIQGEEAKKEKLEELLEEREDRTSSPLLFMQPDFCTTSQRKETLLPGGPSSPSRNVEARTWHTRSPLVGTRTTGQSCTTIDGETTTSITSSSAGGSAFGKMATTATTRKTTTASFGSWCAGTWFFYAMMAPGNWFRSSYVGLQKRWDSVAVYQIFTGVFSDH